MMAGEQEQNSLYDVIVVGAGVEGSATAYQLSRRGVRVLLLEQFSLPHSRGSSHGQSRITRKAYKQSFYTAMMEYCTNEWEDLQRSFGQIIFKKVGFLAIGTLGGEYLKGNISSLEENGMQHTVYSTEEFRSKYPNLRYGDAWGAVFDPDGGILIADKVLQAFQTLFVRNGGHLRDGQPVVDIAPGKVIKVTTPTDTYRSKSLVTCCGPWTNKVMEPLLLKLPLKPIKISVCYWPEKVPGTYRPEALPAFFDQETPTGTEIYGIPSDEYPGSVKLCLHDGSDIDPDNRDSVDNEWAVKLASEYVSEHFPGLVAKPNVVEACIYTNTPDTHFILDRHPIWKNIVIGAGFSGHGFKLSPAVGQILADLAMDRPPNYDISHFRMDRFPQSKNLKSHL